MKLRARRGFYNDRQQSRCTCQWCGEWFLSQRSDSKYCCDSHKTLASNARMEQRREQERMDEERRRQYYIHQQKTSVASPTKPPETICKPQPQSSNDDWKEFEQTISEMLEKSRKEQKLREEKHEMERYEKMFTDIVQRMQRCSSVGAIRYSDISALQSKVSAILLENKLGTCSIFQQHLEFVDQIFRSYVEELRREFRRSGARRLEYNPPEEVLRGLEMLRNPEVTAI